MYGRNHYEEHSQGSSAFANIPQIRNARLYKEKGIYQGECPHRHIPLHLDGDSPVITIAGARSGKGRDVLLFTALYIASMLAVDIKGELAAITAQAHRKSGKSVFCINPLGLHRQAPWNLPMHGIDPFDFLTPDSPTLTGDCMLVMEMLIKITGGKSEFFEIKARAWCAALLKYLVLTLGRVTLPEFYAFLNMIESDPVRFKEVLQNGLLNFPSEDVRRTAGEMLYKREQAAGEFSGIVSTIFVNLSFLDDPNVQTCLSGADFSLSDLAKPQKTVVYLIVPAEYVSAWSPLLRLILGVAMIHKQRAPQTKLLLLCDESAQLGRFEMLEKAVTLGGGYGLRTWTVWQDIGQIQQHYNQSGVTTFLGSSQMRQFFGVRDYDTAEMVSKMLGNQTLEMLDYQNGRQPVGNPFSNGGNPFQAGIDLANSARRSKVQRPLLTPSEVLNLPENKQVLFNSGLNCPPILADKVPYYKAKIMKGHFMPSPYHPETRRKLLGIF